MKHLVSLAIVLMVTWTVWSGHFHEPFLWLLGIASVAFCIWMVRRMRILDAETAPTQYGIRPLLYLPYLIKEIAQSNAEVARIVLSPRMPLRRTMVEVRSHQRTEVGRVVFANSITLTPGTVSVRVEDDQILVHALSYEGAAEDMSGEMDRRVCRMEGDAADSDITAKTTDRSWVAAAASDAEGGSS